MTGDFAKGSILGRIGADAELRYVPSGQAVCNFRVASNEFFKDKEGNKKKITTWTRIVLWGKQAEGLAPLLKKGRRVMVDGRIRVRTYEDKTGVKHTTTEINGDEVRLLDYMKKEQAQEEVPAPQPDSMPNEREVRF